MRASVATNSKVNMCDCDCSHSFATCTPDLVEFGDGVGNDNVVVCSQYETTKLYEEIEHDMSLGIFSRLQKG